jgi:hypothetical protein
MDNVVDLIATNASPSEVSDAIKSMLYAKSAEKIELIRPIVAADLFDGENDQETQEEE